MMKYTLSNNKFHWLLGAMLLLIGILISITLIIVHSQATLVRTYVYAKNVKPSIDSVFISEYANSFSNDFPTGIDLSSGSTRSIHVNGVVTDINSIADISKVSLKFYRSGVEEKNNCSIDKNDCYETPICDLTYRTVSSMAYDCPVSLAFYADATDKNGRYPDDYWVAYLQVIDNSNDLQTHNSAKVEMNSLISLSIAPKINYGILSRGHQTTAADNYEMIITQRGNKKADIKIFGNPMICSGGITVIPSQNQEWALTDVGYGLGTELGIESNADIRLNYREDDFSEENTVLYWNIKIPNDVSGDCSGSSTMIAIPHQEK